MVVRGLLAILAALLTLLPLAAASGPYTYTSSPTPIMDHPRGVQGQVCVRDPHAGPGARGCFGAGIPRATVRLTGSGVDMAAETDDWGSFHLDAPGGAAYTLSASRAGFDPAEVRVDGDAYVDLSLAPQKVTAAGRVLDAAGQPVAGASVAFCCPPDGAAPAPTGPDGAFSLSLPAGAYAFEIFADGFAPHKAQVFVDGSPLDATLRPMPERTAVLNVVVRGEDGDPLAGVAVAVEQYACCEDREGRTPPIEVGLHERQLTGADGRAAFRVYPDGHVEVRTDDPATSFASASAWVQGDGPATQELRVVRFPGRDAHVTGRVVDAATGRGIAGYTVSAEHLRFGRSECSEDARAARSGTATYAPPSDAPHPAYGVTYTVAPPYPPYPPHSHHPGERSGCAIRIQPDGTFTADLMPGFTRLRAYAPQHCTETQDAGGGFRRACGPEYLPFVLSLDLPAGNTTGLVLRLQPRPAPDAVVSGYLVDAATQRALPLGRIEFSNEEAPAYGFATTDGDGSYRIRLRSGVHTVTARVDGYFEWQGTVVVPPGDLPFDALLTAGGPEGWQKPWDVCCWEDAPHYAPRECYGCGVTYTMTAMPAHPGPMGMPTMGVQTAYPGEAGIPAGGAGGVVGGSAYSDLGGDLGPYDPEARREVLEAAAGDPSRGAPALPALLAIAIAGLALAAARRRLDR